MQGSEQLHHQEQSTRIFRKLGFFEQSLFEGTGSVHCMVYI